MAIKTERFKAFLTLMRDNEFTIPETLGEFWDYDELQTFIKSGNEIEEFIEWHAKVYLGYKE